jgi:two-component system, OmpR family, sensor histidine kinase CpxA
MRSLFLKLFLWFGLAMVAINIASFATGIITERRFQPPRNHPVATTMAVFAETAARIWEREGQAGLRDYLDRVEQVSAINAVLLDQQGQELSGKGILDRGQSIAARVSPKSPFAIDTSGPPPLPDERAPLAAQLVTSSGGVRYILVGKLPRSLPGPPPRIGEPGSLWFGLRVLARTLLPLLLIGGLFCYLLARYLATPIVKLRRTTHELSDGDLSARVDPALLSRRDEVGYLGQDFNLMASHIQSLVDAQRRLLTDISHELRSPLARQVVALGLARRRGNEEVIPALDRIALEAGRMDDMIGQLLDLSRVENGTETLQTSRIDFSTLIAEIAEDADFEARARGRRVHVAGNEACSLNGVSDLLRSAIENVVRNGVRHTTEGTAVEIRLTCVDGNAVIRVRDHGRGVPENALEDIFRPFYRVEEARDRKTGGAGLGLAIAARAVRLHGGAIAAHNAEGGGLIVEVKLPVNDERGTEKDRYSIGSLPSP